jgi:predicted DNA-binding mobile mystery protein A
MKIETMRILLDDLDRGLGALSAAKSSAKRPAQGWLRAVREAIGLGQQDVAAKLGIRRQSLADLEAAEKRGSATIASLERAAEAMGCELVYYVVPRGPFASTYGELARTRMSKPKRNEAGALPPSSEPFCLTLSQD